MNMGVTAPTPTLNFSKRRREPAQVFVRVVVTTTRTRPNAYNKLMALLGKDIEDQARWKMKVCG